MANVVFILDAPTKDNWDMDYLDDLCHTVSKCLEGIVSFIECWFRTQEEFDDDEELAETVIPVGA